MVFRTYSVGLPLCDVPVDERRMFHVLVALYIFENPLRPLAVTQQARFNTVPILSQTLIRQYRTVQNGIDQPDTKQPYSTQKACFVRPLLTGLYLQAHEGLCCFL
jgi:hypothetical protein